LADGRRVRYIGINAPEIAHGGRPAEPGGNRAAHFNRGLLAAGWVRLEFDAEKRDRYGRWLAYVYTPEGQCINRALLAAGWAYFMPHPANRRHRHRLLTDQRRAMDARLGLWRGWEKQKGHYIGNRRSQRFHNVNCPFGRRTRAANRRVFNSRWEAFRAGYAPCRRCLPQWWH
jgi:micrococcal nuclease